MSNLIDKVLVVLKAAPTYLTAVALVAGILIDELPELPVAVPDWLLIGLAGIVTVVAVATAIIRRVTPVLEDARGILPPPDPGTAITTRELYLERRIDELEELAG